MESSDVSKNREKLNISGALVLCGSTAGHKLHCEQLYRTSQKDLTLQEPRGVLKQGSNIVRNVF